MLTRWTITAIFLFLVSFALGEAVRYSSLQTESQAVHLLEVDPQQCTIVPAKALDQSIGRETVLSIAQRKRAIAAVNGGYFSIGKHDGCPAGILKINGHWYGIPLKPRGAIGWDKGHVIFDRLLTHREGICYHVDAQFEPQKNTLWDKLPHIVGGTPLLIHEGDKIEDFSAEKTVDSFLLGKHARTAVGVLPNGHWIFLVVDGNPFTQQGMTISELADFMAHLGCIEALNLDGGGSSTMVFQNRVMNDPIGDGDIQDENQSVLREVSDAILILPLPG